jgi:hypothetical protein
MTSSLEIGHGTTATLRGAASALFSTLLLASVAGPAPAAAQQGQGEPVTRVGLTGEFSAALDSAPETVNWELLRKTVAVRWEPGGEVTEPTQKHVVLHAAVLHQGSIGNRYDSDPVDLLPGATKLDPDELLPEESMIPDGYRISGTMGFGVVDIPAGQIMSDLLRDIVMPMAQDAPAIWLVSTPPRDQVEGSHKAYPVLIQLAPAGGGG